MRNGMTSLRLEELNTGDYLARGFDKVIVPIGSCESHGDHLPFGTDGFVAHDLALATAERVPGTMVLPPTWYGMSGHYRHKALCVTLSHGTTIALYRDILQSLVDWGFRKILVINGHDGNIPCIHVAALELKMAHPEVGLALLDAWWTVALTLLPKEMWERYDGYGHGGEGETSIAMAMIPHLTDPSRAKGMVDAKDPLIREIWNYQELTDHGATGDGRAATLAKGQVMRTALVDYTVAFLERKEREGWVIPRQEA